MSTVIAERELTLTDGGTGFVRMYLSRPDPEGGQFCELHLAWPGFERKQKVYGEDSWQCVLEALRITPLFLSLTDDFKSGRLKAFDTPLSSAIPNDPERESALAAFFDVKPHSRDVQ
jgi:hypothetical protein